MADGNEFFAPKRFRKEDAALEERLRQIEDALLRVRDFARVVTDPTTGELVPLGGQSLGGGGGAGSSGGTEAHELLNNAYHVDTETGTPVRGDLITGQGASPKFARLGIGASGTVLKSDGTDIAWSTDAHALLSSRHGDVTAASPTRGDLITAQGASPTWSRLAKSATATHVLKAGASEPAWGRVAFGELSDSLVSGQHGSLSDGDHTGDLSGNARVKVKQAGSVVGIRRGINFIQGSNITLTVADDDANEEVDVTIAATSGGSTPHNLLSSTHPDTTAASPSRGDLILAQGTTPSWRRLALGASGQVLRSNETDAVWAQLSHADLDPATVTPNAHHNQQHLFFGSDHSDVTGTPASGDLIYRNGSAQWTRLGKGTDGQILKLTSGLPSWANVNSVATTRALIQGWKRDDIRNANTTFDEMNGFDGLKTGETMAYSGTLVGIAVALEKDLDNGGAAASASYTLTVYKSSNQGVTWSATAAAVTLSAGTGMERRAYATGFAVSFAAGDMLTIYDRKANLPAISNGSKANVIVVFD